MLGRARSDGWRRASGHALLWLAIFAAPLLVACELRERESGHFRLHSFSGQNVFGVAFEVAEPGDEAAFPEPELHAFVARALEDGLQKRVPVADCEFVNVNTFAIGIPAYRATEPPDVAQDAYHQDDVLGAVGKRLIARHPAAFLGVVRSNLAQAYGVHLLALGLAALVAFASWWRTRAGELLAASFFALAPLVAILPACVLNVPLPRYRSQLEPLELVAIPLLVTLLATLGSLGRARGTTSPAA